VTAQANAERLRALLAGWEGENLCDFADAFRRGEVDLSLLDGEVEYEDTILPDHVGEVYRGHEGVVRAMGRWAEPFDELRVSIEGIVGDGDTLVSLHRMRANAERTGLRFEETVAYVWRFRDGRVSFFRSYWDTAAALAEAGLSDRPAAPADSG
jgi:ketosteroid isomerase-like protein